MQWIQWIWIISFRKVAILSCGFCNQHAAEALFSSRSEATRPRWPNTSRLLEKPGLQRNLTKFNITSWLTPKQNPAPKTCPCFCGKTTASCKASRNLKQIMSDLVEGPTEQAPSVSGFSRCLDFSLRKVGK